MKRNLIKKMKGQIRIIFSLFAVLFFVNDMFADNPVMSNYMFNMSMGTEYSAQEDYVPEMVIEGNFIHTVWTSYTGGDDAYLYYRRSEDLGKTWGAPQKLVRFNNLNYARDIAAVRLAVSNNQVHIAYSDNSGGGRLYYLKSSDNGKTFSQPRELESAESGYNVTTRTFIRSRGNQVVIAYQVNWWNDINKGIYIQTSSDGGQTFSRKLVTEENTNLFDFDFDGQTMALLLNYTYYYYGLNVGTVHVASSINSGNSFTINKVSVTYDTESGTQERCLVWYDNQYVPKIRIDGASIHTIFLGNNEKGVWTVLYARSMNNGQKFEKTIDLNNVAIGNEAIQNGHESVEAINGNVYLQLLTQSSKVWLAHSANNGSTLSELKSILPTDAHYGKTTWYPRLAIDRSDATGKTIYMGGAGHLTYKSTNGGESFWGIYYLSPMMNYESQTSNLVIDSQGSPHWLSKGRYGWNNGWDIFYVRKQIQPSPGNINQSYKIVTTADNRNELAMVPSSETMEFDSVLTAEAWVKINPGSGLNQNVLTKFNGVDGVHYEDPGFQLSFDDNYGKRRFRAGITTDKGGFINWTGTDVQDTLWHHVAFSYDANAGLDNFKSYIDGQLIAKQTVTGRIVRSDGILVIGSREAFRGQPSSYEVDEIRLWRRAITQEELIENQTKKFTGNEEALMLYLNFNGTFKDISGNGNDAIPVYMGELKKSDFNPPIVDFDMYTDINKVVLNNKTQNGSSYSWDFGDEKTSLLENPVNIYTNPGEYKITLIARNSNSAASGIKSVTIAGLDRIEPTVAGNTGNASFTIYGGGIDSKSTVKLEKDGVVIIADTAIVIKDGELNVSFDLEGQSVGKWNVVVKISGVEYTLKEALTIEAGNIVDPYIYVTGRSTVLLNRWFIKTIEFGNNGNVDIFNVPLFIAISDIPGIEVEFINVDFQKNMNAYEDSYKSILDTIPLYFISEGYYPNNQNARIYPLIIPNLAQGVPQKIMLRIKSPASYNLDSYIGAYSEDNTLKSNRTRNANLFSDCFQDAMLANLYTGAGMALSLALTALPIGCVKSTLDASYKTTSAIYKGEGGWTVAWNMTWDLTAVTLRCAKDLPVMKAYKAAVEIAKGCMSLYSVGKKYYDCFKFIRYADSVFTVSSFDPNEMIGPSGFGDQHWIQKNSKIPYTVLFENKSTATAPAHEVFVTDTLDLKKFDLKEFGFSAFGFGDTILSPNGTKLKKFAMDVDLRPKKNLITRVSGNLDTITGVIRWEFLSLNPISMEYEEDPLIGFLPPNNSNREGEGFVSFYVGLKNELGTNDQIKNRAIIVFDANAPIVTNQFINTLDMDLPVSKVDPLNETSGNRLNLTWSGSDGGSGIGSYSVYYLENDTLLAPVIANTTETSTLFIANVGSKYKFYSIAIDNVSLREDDPSVYDASTHVTVDVKEFNNRKDNIQIFPNPARGEMNVMLAGASEGVYLVELIDMKGKSCFSDIYESRSISRGIKINTEQFSPGLYLIRMVYGNTNMTRKIRISNKSE